MRRQWVVWAMTALLALPTALTRATAAPVPPVEWSRAARYARLSDDIYLRHAGDGNSAFAALHPRWTVVDDAPTGLRFAWNYSAAGRHLVIVFRGTVSARNWAEDVEQGLGLDAARAAALRRHLEALGIAPSAGGGARDVGRAVFLHSSSRRGDIYVRSHVLVKALLAQHHLAPARITFAGHSLGGGLAQFNALFYPRVAEVYAYNPAALSEALLESSGVSTVVLPKPRVHLFATHFVGAGCSGDPALACVRVDDVVSSLTPFVELLNAPPARQLGPLVPVTVSERRDAWPLGMRVTPAARRRLERWMVPVLAALLPATSGAGSEAPPAHPYLAELVHPLRAEAALARRLALARAIYLRDVRADDGDLTLLYMRPAHSMRLLRNAICRLAATPACSRGGDGFDAPAQRAAASGSARPPIHRE